MSGKLLPLGCSLAKIQCKSISHYDYNYERLVLRSHYDISILTNNHNHKKMTNHFLMIMTIINVFMIMLFGVSTMT